ncbi:MAG: cyclic nucleotide-binding domain-containing protein [Planctomycetes bacterium]|nr:cyclic nucleotide-binding domain-containing protein [Planctomycetota bacterium]
MSDKTLTAAQLEQIPIFAGLTVDQLKQLSGVAELVAAPAGQTIVEQDGMSQYLWVLLEGRCEVALVGKPNEAKQPIVLATLEPYSNFGEMSFFHAAPHSACVRAKGPVQLLRLDREAFDKLGTTQPAICTRLAMNTVANLAERMRRMDNWVAELVRKTNGQKVPDLDQLRVQLFDSWKL